MESTVPDEKDHWDLHSFRNIIRGLWRAEHVRKTGENGEVRRIYTPSPVVKR
jgi:hypothetical protein